MDILKDRNTSELHKSLLAEIAKSQNEINQGLADIRKAQSRINFLIVLSNELIQRDLTSNSK